MTPSPDPGAPADPLEGESPRAPLVLRLAAALVAVEAVLFMAYGALQLLDLSGSKVAEGVSTAVFFVAYGAALAYFALTVARLESWARAPLVLAQLIQLGVSWNFRGSGPVVAAALAVLAVLVLVGIFHPASLRALAEPPEHADG